VAAVKLGPARKEVAKSIIAALETAKLDLVETEQQLEVAQRNSTEVKRHRLAYERRVQQKMQEAMRQISRAKRADMQKQMAGLMMSFEAGSDDQVLDQMTARIDEDLARAEARTEIASETIGAQVVDIEASAIDDAAEQRYQEYARQLGTVESEDVVQKTLDSITVDVEATEAQETTELNE